MIRKKQPTKIEKITNDTINEHRRQIIDNGKKFKYPVQYSKYKLVINTLIIVGAIFVVGAIWFWFSLYKAQSTGSFIYRLTTIIPVPVANVDGENARYSDYLVEYRSNMMIVDKNKGRIEDSGDVQTRSKIYKKQSMDNAIKNAYAMKIARENNLKVSKEEFDNAYNAAKKIQNTDISEPAFTKIINDNYGLTPSEFKRMFIELPLIRQKASVFMDKDAEHLKDEVAEFMKNNGNDFVKVAQHFGNKIQMGESGIVKSTNVDKGRTAVASTLKEGEVSAPFVSTTDGYYFIKLLSRNKNDNSLKYSFIKVPLKEFDKQIEKLKDENKIHEYIKIEE